MWPEAQRPAPLRVKKTVNAYKLEDILALFRLSKEAKKAEKDEEDDLSVKEGSQPTVEFRRQKDDRRKRLHPASFMRLPIRKYKHWYKNVPVKRKPFIKSMDLEFTGTRNAVTDVTLKRMHDRTKALQLKHFFSGNLNVTSKKTEVRQVTEAGKIETSYDYAWSDPSTVHQIQEALVNYACCLHPLFPTDPTGLILFRVLITFKWLVHVDEQKRSKIILAFVQEVLRQNSSRAVNKEEPLSFEEQRRIIKMLLTTSGYRPEIPLIEARGPAPPAQRQREAAPDRQKGKRAGSDKRTALFKTKDGATIGVCYGFNDSGNRPCTNAPYGEGCRRPDGTVFAHVCNMFSAAKGQHCLGKHPRRQHK